jgi:hypothetical protein
MWHNPKLVRRRFGPTTLVVIVLLVTAVLITGLAVLIT